MKAFYAGSFDPFTIGHQDIALRAAEMFGELIIGVGYNESKRSEESVEKRLLQISKIFSGDSRIKVVAYEGLTAEAARELGATVLVRGVRNSLDFEKEKELADINLEVMDFPTVFIPARPELSYISSSMVRELTHNHFDISKFIPKR